MGLLDKFKPVTSRSAGKRRITGPAVVDEYVIEEKSDPSEFSFMPFEKPYTFVMGNGKDPLHVKDVIEKLVAKGEPCVGHLPSEEFAGPDDSDCAYFLRHCSKFFVVNSNLYMGRRLKAFVKLAKSLEKEIEYYQKPL